MGHGHSIFMCGGGASIVKAILHAPLATNQCKRAIYICPPAADAGEGICYLHLVSAIFELGAVTF